MDNDLPTDVKLHKKSATLELVYGEDSTSELSAEFLRVHSPSAEVRGHGRGQEVLQVGKRRVKISSLETVGNYAIKLAFDDGHDTGIYSWTYLKELCRGKEDLWQRYLNRLTEAGANRDALPADTQVLSFKPSPSK
ncbi:MAG: DUF971 domain-containing protein [Pseudomonadales bacterium]|jgi:DUF971 family protein|nr:DUF971 domain-containing protein [Pseudomonadales bacterium]